MFPSPKKVVRRLKFIPSALLLSFLRYRFAIAFSGSLSDSFSPASRVYFSRQANKERHSRRFKSCDMDSLVRCSTHDLLPLDRKDTPPSLPRLLASNGSLSGENDCHETSRSLRRQHSTVENQRVTRSLQTTVLPEMRTRQPGTELGVVFLLAGKKHGLGTNLFSFCFFFLKLFSEKQNSGRDKASWSSQHQKKSKIEDQTENLARTTWSQLNSHTVLCLCSAAEGVATT